MAVPGARVNASLTKMHQNLVTVAADTEHVIGDLEKFQAAAAKANAEMAQAALLQKTMQEGFGSLYNTIFDIQTMLNDGYKNRPDKPTGGGDAYAQAYASKLQTLVDQITKIMGPNNPFAVDISKEVTLLQSGVLAPQEALQVLQGVLGAFIPGLMQEIADPSTNPPMRELAQTLLRYLNSGSLNV